MNLDADLISVGQPYAAWVRKILALWGYSGSIEVYSATIPAGHIIKARVEDIARLKGLSGGWRAGFLPPCTFYLPREDARLGDVIHEVAHWLAYHRGWKEEAEWREALNEILHRLQWDSHNLFVRLELHGHAALELTP